jgi:hypothetical protein
LAQGYQGYILLIILRNIHLTGLKGYKSVCIYKNGNKCHSKRKKLSSEEMSKIKSGKFIPGLFSKLLESNTRRRSRK